MGTDGDDEEWRFAVEDVGDDDDDPDEPGTDADAETEESDAWDVTVGDDDGPAVTVGGPERAAEELEEASDGNVAGSLSADVPVERGTPELENAVGVAAGALVTILVFVSLVVSDPVVIAGVGVAVVAAVVALYLFFTRV